MADSVCDVVSPLQKVDSVTYTVQQSDSFLTNPGKVPLKLL